MAMSGPGNGFGESVRKFSDDVDAAVGRARRASAEAGARSASFRAESRELAERLRSGAAKASSAETTPEELRRAAAGFRADRGLPTEDLPEPVHGPAAEEPTDKTPASAGASRRGAEPANDDEDDDFSQERIMMRR
jgi:hypothetical protein